MAPATKEDVLKSKDVNFLRDQFKSIWDEKAKLKKGNDDLKEKLQKKRTEVLNLQGEIGKLKSAPKNENSSCGSCSHNCCQKLKECKKELHSCQKDLKCREKELECCQNDLKCCQKELKCCRDDLKCCRDDLKCCRDVLKFSRDDLKCCRNNLECREIQLQRSKNNTPTFNINNAIIPIQRK